MDLIAMSGLPLAFIANRDWSRPVTFESLESVTETGSPVFNQVRFLPGPDRDVWIMRQSHHGPGSSAGKWDRLAIEVEKSGTSGRALFFQLKPGAGLGYDPRERIPLRARCFACHANGPRAIRPRPDSGFAKQSPSDRLRVFAWNLRIKAYGRLESLPGREFTEGVPFKSGLALHSRPLGLASCKRCHSWSGIRNPLTLEHLGTARFLMDRGLMPPFPFRATPEEKDWLRSTP